KPSALLLPWSPLLFWRAVRRSIAPPFAAPRSPEGGDSVAGVSSSRGGNCSPPTSGSAGLKDAPPPPPFIGLATPKLGRPPPTPLRLPNALIPALPLRLPLKGSRW